MSTLPDSLLEEIEGTAVELARVAGAEIETALGRVLAVRYKGDGTATTDPVSEVDHHVEVVIRARLGERFPDHAIIGEEIDEGAAEARELTWVVDPIDGTANFVNGFPLFAASVGVLHHGRPPGGRAPPRPPCGGRSLALAQPPLRGRRLPRPRGRAAPLRGRRARDPPQPRAAAPPRRRARHRRAGRGPLGRAGDGLGRDRVRVRGRRPAARGAVPGPERLGRRRRRGAGARGGARGALAGAGRLAPARAFRAAGGRGGGSAALARFGRD